MTSGRMQKQSKHRKSGLLLLDFIMGRISLPGQSLMN
jgi:hypothetical protein